MFILFFLLTTVSTELVFTYSSSSFDTSHSSTLVDKLALEV